MSEPAKISMPPSGTTRAVETRLGGGERPEHILKGLADDVRDGRNLARNLEQAGGGGAARARQHQVEDHRRRIDQQPAREVGWEQSEAGDEQISREAPRDRRGE